MLKPSDSAHKRLGDDVVVPCVAAVSVAVENVSRGAQGGGEKAPASEQFALADGHAKVWESSMPPEIDGSFVIVSEIPALVVEKPPSLSTAHSLVREVLTADSIEPADSPPAVKDSLDTQEDLILKENAWMDDATNEQKHDVLEETKGSPEMPSKSSIIVFAAEGKHGNEKVGPLSAEGSRIPVFVSKIPVVADDSAVLADVTAGMEESLDDFVKDAGVFTEAEQGLAKGRMATDDRVVNSEKPEMPYSGESRICRGCLQNLSLPIPWL